ncbi:transmembrane domain within N-terminus, partial [Cryptosporidium felis]
MAPRSYGLARGFSTLLIFALPSEKLAEEPSSVCLVAKLGVNGGRSASPPAEGRSGGMELKTRPTTVIGPASAWLRLPRNGCWKRRGKGTTGGAARSTSELRNGPDEGPQTGPPRLREGVVAQAGGRSMSPELPFLRAPGPGSLKSPGRAIILFLVLNALSVSTLLEGRGFKLEEVSEYIKSITVPSVEDIYYFSKESRESVREAFEYLNATLTRKLQKPLGGGDSGARRGSGSRDGLSSVLQSAKEEGSKPQDGLQLGDDVRPGRLVEVILSGGHSEGAFPDASRLSLLELLCYKDFAAQEGLIGMFYKELNYDFGFGRLLAEGEEEDERERTGGSGKKNPTLVAESLASDEFLSKLGFERPYELLVSGIPGVNKPIFKVDRKVVVSSGYGNDEIRDFCYYSGRWNCTKYEMLVLKLLLEYYKADDSFISFFLWRYKSRVVEKSLMDNIPFFTKSQAMVVNDLFPGLFGSFQKLTKSVYSKIDYYEKRFGGGSLLENKLRRLGKVTQKEINWMISLVLSHSLQDKEGNIAFVPYFNVIPHNSTILAGCDARTILHTSNESSFDWAFGTRDCGDPFSGKPEPNSGATRIHAYYGQLNNVKSLVQYGRLLTPNEYSTVWFIRKDAYSKSSFAVLFGTNIILNSLDAPVYRDSLPGWLQDLGGADGTPKVVLNFDTDFLHYISRQYKEKNIPIGGDERESRPGGTRVWDDSVQEVGESRRDESFDLRLLEGNHLPALGEEPRQLSKGGEAGLHDSGELRQKVAPAPPGQGQPDGAVKPGLGKGGRQGAGFNLRKKLRSNKLRKDVHHPAEERLYTHRVLERTDSRKSGSGIAPPSFRLRGLAVVARSGCGGSLWSSGREEREGKEANGARGRDLGSKKASRAPESRLESERGTWRGSRAGIGRTPARERRKKGIVDCGRHNTTIYGAERGGTAAGLGDEEGQEDRVPDRAPPDSAGEVAQGGNRQHELGMLFHGFGRDSALHDGLPRLRCDSKAHRGLSGGEAVQVEEDFQDSGLGGGSPPPGVLLFGGGQGQRSGDQGEVQAPAEPVERPRAPQVGEEEGQGQPRQAAGALGPLGSAGCRPPLRTPDFDSGPALYDPYTPGRAGGEEPRAPRPRTAATGALSGVPGSGVERLLREDQKDDGVHGPPGPRGGPDASARERGPPARPVRVLSGGGARGRLDAPGRRGAAGPGEGDPDPPVDEEGPSPEQGHPPGGTVGGPDGGVAAAAEAQDERVGGVRGAEGRLRLRLRLLPVPPEADRQDPHVELPDGPHQVVRERPRGPGGRPGEAPPDDLRVVGPEVDGPEQSRDVLELGGESAPDHVVRAGHALQALPGDVGVDGPRADEDRVPGAERVVVQEERTDDPDVQREVAVQLEHEEQLGPQGAGPSGPGPGGAAGVPEEVPLDPRDELPEGLLRGFPAGAQHAREHVPPQPLLPPLLSRGPGEGLRDELRGDPEERQELGEVADVGKHLPGVSEAAEQPKLGESQGQLRLVVVVRVDGGGAEVELLGQGLVGVDLEREGLLNGQDLGQEGEPPPPLRPGSGRGKGGDHVVQGHPLEPPAVQKHAAGARGVGAVPELREGLRLPLRLGQNPG